MIKYIKERKIPINADKRRERRRLFFCFLKLLSFESLAKSTEDVVTQAK